MIIIRHNDKDSQKATNLRWTKEEDPEKNTERKNHIDGKTI